jgi:hypothetical protein
MGGKGVIILALGQPLWQTTKLDPDVIFFPRPVTGSFAHFE